MEWAEWAECIKRRVCAFLLLTIYPCTSNIIKIFKAKQCTSTKEKEKTKEKKTKTRGKVMLNIFIIITITLKQETIALGATKSLHPIVKDGGWWFYTNC